MQRKQLNINDYQYLVEYDHSNKTNNFFMIRSYNYVNNIAYDISIMFIDADTFRDLVAQINNGETIDEVVFPVSNNSVIQFSKSFKDFNYNLSEKSFTSVDTSLDGIGEGPETLYEVYPILKEKESQNEGETEYEFANINLDSLKIYHPITKKNLDSFIEIDNVINGIHFIYLCRPLHKYQSYSTTEIKYNNNVYSEYIEVLFPNVLSLFNNTKFKENINIMEVGVDVAEQNEDYLSRISDELGQYYNLDLLIQPWQLKVNTSKDSDIVHYIKHFTKHHPIYNMLNKNQIDVSIYPYDAKGETADNLYVYDEVLYPGSTYFYNEYTFKLNGHLEFNDTGEENSGKICVYGKFSYSPDLVSNDYDGNNPIEEAYCTYFNIQNKNIYNIEVYNETYNEEIQELLEQKHILEEKLVDDTKLEEDKKYINKQFNILNLSKYQLDSIKYELKQKIVEYQDKDINIEKLNEQAKKDIMLKYYDLKIQMITNPDEDMANYDFVGYYIEIATNYNFDNLLYNKYIPVSPTKKENSEDIESININNFTFEINNILTTWDEQPKLLLCRLTFIDRFVGTRIISNPIIITPEYYKYIVNNSGEFKLKSLENKNKEFYNKYKDMKVLSLKDNKNAFYFIDKINCIVKDSNDKEVQDLTLGSMNTSFFYHPIFFKVNELQKIKLRRNAEQNIGISLFEYISKVESFKLQFDDYVINELGRNNNIVIFKINPNKIANDSGYYNILNQNDEYISYGEYRFEKI